MVQEEIKNRMKIRFYYKPEKQMILFTNPCLLSGGFISDKDWGGLYFHSYDHKLKEVEELKREDFEVMFPTGKQDINLESIFEGDIVRVNGGLAYCVEWNYEQCSFVLTKFYQKKTIEFLFASIDKKERIEVIGNKYQNPELLEV